MRTQYKPSQATLSMDDIDKCINACKDMRDRMIIESLYFPAMRRAEVCKLQVHHFDFERGRIVIDDTVGKGGKSGVIPVGATFPQYLTNIKHFLGNRKSGYVFLSNRRKPISVRRVNQILEEITKALNFKLTNPNRKYINPHIFRHSLARHLKSLDFRAEFIQNYLRHESIKTTMDTYGTLSLDEMEKYALGRRKLIS